MARVLTDKSPNAATSTPTTPAAIQPRDRLLADASLLLTATLWGMNIPVVKFATQTIEPLVFNASRMVLSTLVLGLLAWLESYWVKQPNARLVISRFFVFAMISGLLYPLVFMFGIDRTTAGNTALLLSSMPLWTALISACFIGERLPLLTWLALLVAFIGTAIVVVAGGKVNLSADTLFGNLLILLSAMLWATGTVLSGPLLKQISALRLAFYSSLLCTPIHLLIVREKLPGEILQLRQPENLWALVYSGIFSTGIAYATWHIGVRKLGGSHAAVYQNVVTLVAVLGGWLLLAEPLLSSQVLGGLLMLIGVFLMRYSRKTL